MTTPQAITHYENFPVASLLCPPALRPPIAAIYAFARTADDIADEGDASAEQRLADLTAYRIDCTPLLLALPPAHVGRKILPLAAILQSHQLPVVLLDDLLSAFMQDVQKTAAGAAYADRSELLDYCRRSANPVGRLLLHLYGVQDATALRQSDAICTALQLINFWQDLSVDIPRQRFYLPEADRTRHRVPQAELLAQRLTPASAALVLDCAQWARTEMLRGAPLVHRLPGRIGWELRLVVQGGLRILDKVEALDGASLQQRPRIRPWDGPWMLARALKM